MIQKILSPSAGTVIDVKEESGHWHVSIFLSVLDNHSQYIPFDCVCKSITYKPGKFHLAHMLGKSDKNERSVTVFESAIGTFAVTQIAGLVARRILNHCKIGTAYKQGHEYGEILLGSRVDITLPKEGVMIRVKKGKKLKAPADIIATYTTVKELAR